MASSAAVPPGIQLCAFVAGPAPVARSNALVGAAAFASPRRLARGRGGASCARAALAAVLFDCDGVLAETERDAHRVAFNRAFAERAVDTVWGEELYGRLLETGGGKERMTAHWDAVGWPAGYTDAESRTALVKGLHQRKTEIFMDLVQKGEVPLREGVKRLIQEATEAGVHVAVCSTSSERAVAEIVAQLGPDFAESIPIFAGDVVARKKPSPDIYLLAAEKLALTPSNVCVIEDTHIGLKAAKAAGMHCLVTKSIYTQNEDFSGADRVVDSLEDPKIALDDLFAITNLP